MSGTKLDEILAKKREELRALLPRLEELRAAASERREFRSLENALMADRSRLGLLAEIKRASPSVGVIRGDVDPVKQGQAYEKAGASAISVLTDEVFFYGCLADMTKVRSAVKVPVLRKDFIIHEAQIFEAAAAGADAILLIVAALPQDDLERLQDTAGEAGLECLVEAHDLAEVYRAREAGARLIGVNNRNLKTFQVDLAVTESMAEACGNDVVLVAESGIKTPEDAQRMAAAGVDALLVGESLMRAENLTAAVKAFRPARPA